MRLQARQGRLQGISSPQQAEYRIAALYKSPVSNFYVFQPKWMGIGVNIKVKSRYVRNLLYQVYRAYSACYRWYPPPKVLVNSVPKAGTHLVRSMLQHVPKFKFYGLHVENRRYLANRATANDPEHQFEFNFDRLRAALAKTPNGQFITAHLPYQAPLYELLQQLNYKTILIVRDPRDVTISHAKYVAGLERHPLHRRYSALANESERLLASICGISKTPSEYGLTDIGTRFRSFSEWKNRPDVLVCRFEDLVGPKGGGSYEAQLSAVARILEFIERPMDAVHVQELANKAWSSNTSTFRKGQIKDWPNHFDSIHRGAFKNVAGDLLIELGYEENLNW